MPVRSLNSSVMKWPDARTVKHSLRLWAKKVIRERSEICRIGYIGSYARGDWGVGSDLDLLIVLENSDLPFEKRSIEWDATKLPVPTDLMVYTKAEWEALPKKGKFKKTVEKEAVWIYKKE